MARLIDADAFIADYCENCGGGCDLDDECCSTVDDLMKAPTVDAVPVVHGRWEQVQRWATKAKYRCSVCGREIMSAVRVNIEKYPYCHCGADMRDGDGNGTSQD